MNNVFRGLVCTGMCTKECQGTLCNFRATYIGPNLHSAFIFHLEISTHGVHHATVLAAKFQNSGGDTLANVGLLANGALVTKLWLLQPPELDKASNCLLMSWPSVLRSAFNSSIAREHAIAAAQQSCGRLILPVFAEGNICVLM